MKYRSPPLTYEQHIHVLHLVYNAEAHVIARISSIEQMIPVFPQFHWIPLKYWMIIFSEALLL